jgi:hypothetical protein
VSADVFLLSETVEKCSECLIAAVFNPEKVDWVAVRVREREVVMDGQCWSALTCCEISGIDEYGGSGVIARAERGGGGG